MRLAALLVSALLVAPVLAGCGGKSSDEKAASEWADGLCQSFVDWRGSVQSAATKFTGGQVSKETLEDAASSISDANSKLADDLDGLGKPPGRASEEAQEAIKELSKNLRDSADKIKDAASDVSSRQDVVTAVQTIGTTLAAMGNDLSAAGDKLQGLGDKDTWKKAFSESEACKTLTSG